MKKITLVFLSLFTICLLGACGNKQKMASKQVLTWTETSTLATQDQSLATDSLSFQTLLNTQEGLYRLDKQQKPKLALAKSVKISNDGKTYDFILRPNAKWSNGDPVTAKDFVYAYKRTVTPSTKASMAFYFYQNYYLLNIRSQNQKLHCNKHHQPRSALAWLRSFLLRPFVLVSLEYSAC